MLKYENVICNYAANVGIGIGKWRALLYAVLSWSRTEQLRNQHQLSRLGESSVTPSPLFRDGWKRESANISTTGRSARTPIVQIDQMDADGKPLLNGTYSDTITVAVGATRLKIRLLGGPGLSDPPISFA